LVIDPVLLYSTYLGGTQFEEGTGIAVDSAGNAYVTGFTTSPNFPTQNPNQPFGGPVDTTDAFITKLDPTGSMLVYSTFLGGRGNEFGLGIAADPLTGSACVTGTTNSSGDFPRRNPLQPNYGGGSTDMFVTRLQPDGTLLWSTFLGGTGQENPPLGRGAAGPGAGVALDINGNVYVTSSTDSQDFPRRNEFQLPPGGGSIPNTSAFVTEILADGSDFVYSSYLGGIGLDFGTAIAVDEVGRAYVTGATSSSDFPTVNAYQAGFNGGTLDAFVTQIEAGGLDIRYSTFFGALGDEVGHGIAVDSSTGLAYVTGLTDSDNFPIVGEFQSFLAGSTDAWVAAFHPATGGSASLVYSTYMGGRAADGGQAIATNGRGTVWVAGFTDSDNFPTQDPFQPNNAGMEDAFVAEIDPSQAGNPSLLSSTYLGDTDNDFAFGVAVDGGDNAYVTGGDEFPPLPHPESVPGQPEGAAGCVRHQVRPGCAAECPDEPARDERDGHGSGPGLERQQQRRDRLRSLALHRQESDALDPQRRGEYHHLHRYPGPTEYPLPVPGAGFQGVALLRLQQPAAGDDPKLAADQERPAAPLPGDAAGRAGAAAASAGRQLRGTLPATAGRHLPGSGGRLHLLGWHRLARRAGGRAGAGAPRPERGPAPAVALPAVIRG
jgi:hypothetical protein